VTADELARPDPAARVKQALTRYERFLNPSWVKGFRFAGLETLEVEAEGVTIRDVYGREFLDFACGPSVFILGHRHPRVMAAVRAELERMPLSVRILPNEPMAELAELLAEVTPGDLQRSFFVNSGAEANEAALKLARLATGRREFVATEGAFHGKTFGALSVSGRDEYRDPFQPLLAGVTHVPFDDLPALEAAVGSRTAAVILEPIQGENGVVVPSSGYLRGVRRICDRSGALLILDEVQTGMGRTGRMWACEWEGVTPDLLTTAKGFGGGVAPAGAVVARPDVFAPLATQPYLHSTTFGNRLAWVAAIETIRTIRSEGLLDRAVAIGARLLAGLRQVQQDLPSIVRDVRGKGCLVGVEFVHPDLGLLIMSGLFSRNVLGFQTLNRREVVRFAPPLIATDADVDRAIHAMAEAAKEAEALVAMAEEEGTGLKRGPAV